MNLVAKAAAFAEKAHAGQVRKYTHEPYFTHVEAVAKAVAADGADEATIAAAYLHDTIEDTSTTYEQLVIAFGIEVADLVVELTHVYTPEDYPHLNRRARKALEIGRLARISKRAKTIKRADLAHNGLSIVKHDPDFAKVFLPEVAATLEAMGA